MKEDAWFEDGGFFCFVLPSFCGLLFVHVVHVSTISWPAFIEAGSRLSGGCFSRLAGLELFRSVVVLSLRLLNQVQP